MGSLILPAHVPPGKLVWEETCGRVCVSPGCQPSSRQAKLVTKACRAQPPPTRGAALTPHPGWVAGREEWQGTGIDKDQLSFSLIGAHSCHSQQTKTFL